MSESDEKSTGPSETAQPIEESRIVIRPGGEVVIENLSALLAQVAEELDPDVELSCAIDMLKKPESSEDSA